MLNPRQDTQGMPGMQEMQDLPTDNKGPLIIGITVMFEVFAAIAMAMRFWSLHIRRQKLATHDFLIIIGFIVATALAVCLIVSVEEGGLGAQAWTLAETPWKLVTFGKLLIAIQLLWAVSMTAIRCSILFLYTHIFSSSRAFRYVCYAMMGACILWAVGDILTVTLLCRPISFNWDKTVDGSCGDINAAYLAVHSLNFAIDAGIAVLPVPVLWGLQMPTANKVGIMVMFALGALICAISIARIALYQLALAYDQSNFTYDGSTLYLFTVMEPLVACSLACIPMLRPVTERFATSSLVSWTKSLVSGGTSASKSKGVSKGSGGSASSSSSSGPKLGAGYVETNSTEGLHNLASPVTTAAAASRGRASPDIEYGRASSGEGGGGGIHVDYHIEQSNYEMQHVPSRQEKDWSRGW